MARASSFLGQVVLGWYLSPAQFGIYGTAIGVLGVTGGARAGGVATFLPTMKPEEFRTEAGRLFGWGLFCVTGGAVLTALAAEPAAVWFNQPPLALALYVLAVRHILAVIALMPRMRMTVDHRFKELAILDTVGSLVKLALTCVLAVWLWDTEYAILAIAVPFAVSTLVEIAYCLPASGITLAEFTPKPRLLWSTAKSVRWALAVAVLFSLNSQANFVLIAKMVPAAAVGWIYFAYQLAVQPMMLFNGALTNVFAPMMARQRGNPAQERETIHRVFAGSMLLIPFVVFGTFALFPSVEALVYSGRWRGATVPFFFLCLGTCFATVSMLLTGPLLGLRQFTTLAGFEATRAIGLIGGTALGFVACLLFGLDLTAPNLADGSPAHDVSLGAGVIAAGIGLSMAGVAVWQIATVMKRYKMPTSELLRALLMGPLVGLLTMVTAISLGDSVSQSVDPRALHPKTDDLIRLAVTGTTFAAISIVCIRFIAEGTLRRTVEVMPEGLRKKTERLLRF
ncbi:MAG: oligosaccharide flippase family protein [Phycisphaerae bacterium]|nr:oligosaccharide flippase family protein [Phycisphaerae bacterium]